MPVNLSNSLLTPGSPVGGQASRLARTPIKVGPGQNPVETRPPIRTLPGDRPQPVFGPTANVNRGTSDVAPPAPVAVSKDDGRGTVLHLLA